MVKNGRKLAGAIRSLISGRGLQLECARVLDEALLMPVLMYGSKTMIWKENERSGLGCTYEHLQRFSGHQENE